MKPLTINPLPRVTSTRIKSVQAISLHKQLSPSHSSMSVRKKDLVYELAKNLNFIKKREKLNAEQKSSKSSSTNDSQHTSFMEKGQLSRLLNIQPKTGPYRYKNYKIVQFSGKGKYSEVYLAQELRTGMYVALKIMKKENLKLMGSRIAQEIKIQYLLTHPNIVKLYTFIQNEQELILVLEYCAHGSLFKRIRSLPEGAFTEDQAKRYIKQVVYALMFLHRNDILHRDLKPENIFLSYDQIKLADFTYSVYSPSQQRQTQCGSPAYLSPEIINGEKYDKSSDLWALGVLAYELCYGETPDQNQNPKFSDELKDFISSLMHLDPNQRMSAKSAYNHPWLQFQQIDYIII